MGSIAGVVSDSAVHKTLLAAVDAAGLVDALNTSAAAGSYTLFAPTDAAFAALPAGTVDCLLLPSNKDTLTDVLLYHVLNEAAAIEAADLPSTATNFTTLSGDKVLVDNVAPQLNDASTVTGADIMASNGIVHVVDAVLIPPGFMCTVVPSTIVEIVAGSPVHPILEDRLSFSGLSDVLLGEGKFTLFAPTDSAFAGLPLVLLNKLAAADTSQWLPLLTEVLKVHVLAVTDAVVRSSDL